MKLAARPLLAWTATSILVLGTISCVLLDPVPELQKPVRRSPTIVKTKVVPDNTRPLLELPPEFVIPVRVPDPGQSYEWAFFYDWDVTAPNNGLIDDRVVPGSSDGLDLRDEHIDMTGVLLDRTRCHRFEFIVTTRFTRQHESDPELTDSVSWWYVPEGSNGCGLYDAGSFSVLDAGPDAEPDGGVLVQ